MARCCWSRYPAYLISVSTDLSSLRTSEERLQSLDDQRSDGGISLEEPRATRFLRRTQAGASCSMVISGRLSSWARGWPRADDRSVRSLPAHPFRAWLDFARRSVLPLIPAIAPSISSAQASFISSSRCCFASKSAQAASEIRPTRRPCGVRRRSALSMRRCRRNSARDVNMR